MRKRCALAAARGSFYWILEFIKYVTSLRKFIIYYITYLALDNLVASCHQLNLGNQLGHFKHYLENKIFSDLYCFTISLSIIQI